MHKLQRPDKGSDDGALEQCGRKRKATKYGWGIQTMKMKWMKIEICRFL